MDREHFINFLGANAQADIDLLKNKNQDYAQEENPFQNFKTTEQVGVCSTAEGIVVRMTDKLQRIANLVESERAVEDETIADTLSDLRNYSNILQVYLEKERNND